jgi:hypothetical protein
VPRHRDEPIVRAAEVLRPGAAMIVRVVVLIAVGGLAAFGMSRNEQPVVVWWYAIPAALVLMAISRLVILVVDRIVLEHEAVRIRNVSLRGIRSFEVYPKAGIRVEETKRAGRLTWTGRWRPAVHYMQVSLPGHGGGMTVNLLHYRKADRAKVTRRVREFVYARNSW